MSQQIQSIKSYKIVYPQVYSYILPNRSENEGSQKIGYTEKKDVDERIKQQVNTAALKEKYLKLWSSPAFFEGNKESFTDKTFHKFLEKNGIEKRTELGSEWFYFNGYPENSKELFELFRKEGFLALQTDKGKIEYVLRDEQKDAVQKALLYFQNNEKGEFLWNAKPRFGKTLATYDLAKRLEAKKVLIVTNRPAIANSWFDDYDEFIGEYAFVSETSSIKNRPTLTREQHISQRPIKPLITFLSLQDLKGSKYFGGDYDKLRWVADLEWDLLIVDEAHEGVDTVRTDAAFGYIKRKHTLHLSGTPFKALANDKFPKDAIFNWTYLDEQKAKREELKQGETGEHTDLPDIKLFTYRISQMIRDEVNQGIEIEDETYDYAFDLNEFFSTNGQRFVYEKEVKQFLINLSTNKKYPFSTPELREELKHTFWYVGNRVNSVKALERLLKEDSVFKDYEIIIAAGNGKSFEEEENDFYANESSYNRVIDAISKHEKTITLSCGQLTTGVTIKEWTAVLMLTDIKTPSLYMQAAFRAQNPYKGYKDDELIIKESAYLFDFAPTRVLEIYDQFANGLNPKAVGGEITVEEREENIRELLNFFPVISEDTNGEMVELDAKQVLTFPNALAAAEIVNARFMTNLLFNESLRGVFNFPKEVEDILNKMPIEKNKRSEKPKGDIELDLARDAHKNMSQKINQNSELILGEKIFRANTERVIDELFKDNEEIVPIEKIAKEITEIAEPLIAKYKEVYRATKAETDEVTKQITEKIEEIAEEYNSAEIKDMDVLKQRVIETLEVDFVMNKVTEKEEKEVEKVSKTKEEEIRERLRSFTRTIPMFIMANDSKEEITIDNFDLEIDDNDFLDLTSITKEEFHKLRDGFDYEEDGERKTFRGVFDKYRFNASIAEFRLRKEKLSDYFTAEEDIFEFIPNQKTNQIFTPKRVVRMMIDNLEEHDHTLFTRTDSTFIDLYMKSGMYITEIVKKLFHNTRKHYNSDEACLKHILENQVYGLSPTPILQGITQTYIFGFDANKTISRKNFVQHDLTPEAKENKAKEKLQELFNWNNDMKFDAVVGNPPYQGVGRQQIYTDFYLSARTIGDVVCLIFPIGWQEPKNANNLAKLNTKEIKEDCQIVQIDNLQGCFPGVSGAEWTNIIIWQKGYNNQLNGKQKLLTNGKEPFILRLKTDENQITKPQEIKKLVSIVMDSQDFRSMQEITSARKPYGLSTDFLKNPIKYNLPNTIFDERKSEEDIKLYSKSKIIKYLPSDYPFPKKLSETAFNEYKVFIPYAWGNWSEGSGLGGAFSDIIIAAPREVATEYALESGRFDKFKLAQNHAKYLMTQFCRACLYYNKHSQHSTTAWEAVPQQDYTESWWDLSISEINEKLFEKYNVPNEIRQFVHYNLQIKDESNIVNFDNI